jgi:hypothetical protein
MVLPEGAFIAAVYNVPLLVSTGVQARAACALKPRPTAATTETANTSTTATTLVLAPSFARAKHAPFTLCFSFLKLVICIFLGLGKQSVDL